MTQRPPSCSFSPPTYPLVLRHACRTCLIPFVGLLVLLAGWSARGDEPKETLANQLRKIEVSLPDSRKEWIKDLRARQMAVNQADRKAWLAIQTKDDWEKFKTPRIEALRKSLGQFPEPGKVAVHVTRKIQGDGFVIENLVYESRPGLWVTANLYSPEKATNKTPGILIIHSHHNPKTQGELQDMGMTWARQGCLVLIPDQLGHGERRQHPFTDAKKYPGPFKVGRQDYYFRYNGALQLHLVGESLIGWMAWDMMRGVDVLYAKPGLDKDAVILLGSVAGGGDPAAVTAALDPRITAVAPFNFGGPQPETKYPLPDDAETSFNYLGGGSWESTRGLRLAGRDGFLPWVIVGSVAPRGLIHAHEFNWDRERDPVWARYQKVFKLYDASDRLAFTHGRGLLQNDPTATHCNNIGPEHRKPIYPTLKKWFDMSVPKEEYRKRLPADDLQCLAVDNPPVKLRRVCDLAADLAKERVSKAWVARVPKLQPQDKPKAGTIVLDSLRTRLPTEWAMRLGPVTPSSRPPAFDVGRHVEPVPHEIGRRADGMGAYLLLPPSTKAKKYRLVVVFAQGGIQALLKERAEALAALQAEGIGVCLAQFRGMDSREGRGRTSGSTSLSATEDMLGATVLGHQLRELRELLAHLRRHDNIDPKRIALWGESLAPVNPPDRPVEVPHDADKMPSLAEPGAGLLALLGTLFEDDVRGVYVKGGLLSYRSLLASPFVHVPHDAVIPGALTVCDVDGLVAALIPRQVLLEGMVTGLNQRPTLEALDHAARLTRGFYIALDKGGSFILRNEVSAPAGLAFWFASVLK